MRMRRAALAVALAGALAFTGAACSEDDAEDIGNEVEDGVNDAREEGEDLVTTIQEATEDATDGEDEDTEESTTTSG